jgi:hypothetical protein
VTTAPSIPHPRRLHAVRRPLSQWNWLIGGLGVAFAMPFVFADVLALPRDLYYGLYMASVLALVTAWVRASQFDVRAALARRWALAVTLGVGCGALLGVMVLRTEDATPHPQGIDLAAAVAWRGVLYGITDGVLLSVFPILAVFAAFAGRPVLRRLRGKLAVGALALGMSLAFTAVYHLGPAMSSGASRRSSRSTRSARRSRMRGCTSRRCCTATTRGPTSRRTGVRSPPQRS